MLTNVVVERCEWRKHCSALDGARRSVQQIERFAVAVQHQQQVAGGLHRRPKKGPQLQRRLRGLQGFLVFLGKFEASSPLDMQPGALRRQFQGPLQPDFRLFEVAQSGRDEGVQAEQVGTQFRGGIVDGVRLAGQETPRGEQVVFFEVIASVVVNRLGVGRLAAVSLDHLPARELGGAELARESAGNQPRCRPAPGAHWPERLGQVIGLEVKTLSVQFQYARQVYGSNFHDVCRTRTWLCGVLRTVGRAISILREPARGPPADRPGSEVLPTGSNACHSDPGTRSARNRCPAAARPVGEAIP